MIVSWETRRPWGRVSLPLTPSIPLTYSSIAPSLASLLILILPHVYSLLLLSHYCSSPLPLLCLHLPSPWAELLRSGSAQTLLHQDEENEPRRADVPRLRGSRLGTKRLSRLSAAACSGSGLTCHNTLKSNRSSRPSFDWNTKTNVLERRKATRILSLSDRCYTRDFSESAGKVLNNFKCVWVTDMWIIVSSLQLPLRWTTLNNKQHLQLTVSLRRPSPLKVINLFVSSRLISRFLPSLISVFLAVFCRSPSLPVEPRASVESWFACDPIVVPVCVHARNLHVALQWRLHCRIFCVWVASSLLMHLTIDS